MIPPAPSRAGCTAVICAESRAQASNRDLEHVQSSRWGQSLLLTKGAPIGRLFELFDGELRRGGYLAMSGQLVDASIVVRPEQRNTRAEKQAMNEGRVPEDWQAKPARLRHEESRCPPDDQSIWRSPSSVTRTILAPTAGTWKRTREQAYPVLLFRADVLDTGPMADLVVFALEMRTGIGRRAALLAVDVAYRHEMAWIRSH